MAILSERALDTATPLPSATVVLVREGVHAPEVFLVHRHSRTSFGASYVFPGGLLEPADCDACAFSRELPAEAADRTLDLAMGGLDYYSAAIRELFEESGVLLARHRGSGRFAGGAVGELETARAQLNSGDLNWCDFLERYRLDLACESLHYLAYWITPRDRPKRFSTRFFLAVLPDGQHAMHDGRELTDSRWMTAAAAIAASEQGEVVLPPPTLATLKDVAHHTDLGELVEWAGRRAASGVPRILPAIVSSGGAERIVMPWHPDYPPEADRGEQ